MTNKTSVTIPIEPREDKARRTEQTQEISSRSSILHLLLLFLNKLPGDFVGIRPVLSKVHHPRVLGPLEKPRDDALRGVPESVYHEQTPPGGLAECIKAVKHDCGDSSYMKGRRDAREVRI